MSLNNFVDLIPTAIHYDSNTLMNKNGELIQIIEVKGHAERFSMNGSEDLKEIIKNVLNEILSEDIMFYLYVKRDFVKLDDNAHYAHEYAQLKHHQWLSVNNLQTILTNTLYIAIVHKGGQSLLSIKNILSQITFGRMIASFQSRLEKAQQKISEVSMKILQAIEPYGVRLLSIKHQNDKFISEPLSFLYYLMHYRVKDIEISTADYSQVIVGDLKVNNLYNTLELDSAVDKSQCYCAALSLKSCYSLSTFYTDQIINLDQRMMIIETIRLGDSKKLSAKLQDLKSLYELSEMQVGVQSVTKDIEALTTRKAVLSQVTIIILGDNVDVLSSNMLKTKNLMYNLGISTIREDFYVFGSTLSTLPGNGHFFRREIENTMNNGAIFTSIKPKSLGGYNGSQWGKPLTVFKTSEGLPYFFNFQNKNNIGHTIVVGSKENGCDLLSEFIILESLKFDLRIIDFYSQEDNNIVKMCQGAVLDENSFSIDMIAILNRDLKEFCKMMHFMLNQPYAEDKQLYISLSAIYNEIVADTPVDLKVSRIVEMIESNANPLDSNLKLCLIKFFSDKCFFKFLEKHCTIENNISNIRISHYIQNLDLPFDIKKNLISLVISFFIKKINNETFISNIHPIIIRTDINILNVPSSNADEYKKILLELAKKGIVIFINCNDKKDLYTHPMLENFIQNCVPTRFFLSEKLIEKKFAKIFQLSAKELNIIKTHHPKECVFLMQQDEYSISASFKALKDF